VTAPIRVVVADDHKPTRVGVRLALEGRGFVVAGEAADAAGAVAAAVRERPDVCLLDINMPGSGIKAAHEIASRLPDTSIVMLTVSRDDADLFDALREGASGYLLKDIDPDRLPDALRAVLEGEAALPRSLTLRLIEQFRGRPAGRRLRVGRGPAVKLTDREWEVLELMKEGLSTADIARRLFLSPVTVRRHIGAILAKVGAPDRKSALRLVREQEEGER
jgi:DNA-binding NarL/FixJ family response regulator